MPLPKLSNSYILVLICIFLSACATRLDYASPQTVDLSGTWVLDRDRSQEVILAPPKKGVRSSKTSKTRGGTGSERSREGKPSRHGQGPGILAGGGRRKIEKPLAMMATEMTIEMSDDSMGVRYENGKYRDVNWGEDDYRGVKTVAGWQGDILLIDIKGSKQKYSESYKLANGGEELLVSFKVDGEEYVRLYQLKNG